MQFTLLEQLVVTPHAARICLNHNWQHNNQKQYFTTTLVTKQQTTYHVFPIQISLWFVYVLCTHLCSLEHCYVQLCPSLCLLGQKNTTHSSWLRFIYDGMLLLPSITPELGTIRFNTSYSIEKENNWYVMIHCKQTNVNLQQMPLVIVVKLPWYCAC